jgi:hypothetical protein
MDDGFSTSSASKLGGGGSCENRRRHVHNGSYNHFRRPETTENKTFAAENKLFSATLGLFSAVPGRQKKSVENKPLFSAARDQPPKIGYFRRPDAQPPKITVNYRRLTRGRRK